MADWFFVAVMVVGVSTLIAVAVLMHRNNTVLVFRLAIVDRVSVAVRADAVDVEWEWRYLVFNKISYERMLFQFWRPLTIEEWWSDVRFVEPSEAVR